MSVAQAKAARRRQVARYGQAPVAKRQGRSVKDAIEAERRKAAKAAQIKNK